MLEKQIKIIHHIKTNVSMMQNIKISVGGMIIILGVCQKSSRYTRKWCDVRNNNNQKWPSKWKCLHLPYKEDCIWNQGRNKCLPKNTVNNTPKPTSQPTRYQHHIHHIQHRIQLIKKVMGIKGMGRGK